MITHVVAIQTIALPREAKRTQKGPQEDTKGSTCGPFFPFQPVLVICCRTRPRWKLTRAKTKDRARVLLSEPLSVICATYSAACILGFECWPVYLGGPGPSFTTVNPDVHGHVVEFGIPGVDHTRLITYHEIKGKLQQ